MRPHILRTIAGLTLVIAGALGLTMIVAITYREPLLPFAVPGAAVAGVPCND